MSNVLIVGANGQVARRAIPMLAAQGHTLTLFARSKARVNAPAGSTVIEGDVLDADALDSALQGQDIVYANLAGNIDELAEALVRAMERASVSCLVFVDVLGIYNELPPAFNEWNLRNAGEDTLALYRRAADVIEASKLDYTIIRPAWLTNADETEYELTGRDEQFKGTEVSRRAVAAFIASVVDDPSSYSRANVGINKPGTDGDKPSWY